MTTQILAFTQREQLRQLLHIECSNMTGLPPVIHGELEDLQAMLDILPVVDFLILDAPESSEQFDLFIQKVLGRESSIKNIICLGELSPSGENIKAFGHQDLGPMLEYLKSKLPGQEKVEGWMSVPLIAFTHFKKLPFDLYVKVSPDTYVKRIPAHEEVDDATIVSFQSRGIQELHFHRQHNRDFSQMLINNMINKLESDYECLDQEFKARSEVFATVTQIVRGLGVNPRVMEVCESVIEEITNDAKKSDAKLASFIEKLKTNPSLNFNYRFVELTSYIGSQLVLGMDGHNFEDVRRLVFSAFFCDITLSKPEYIHHFHHESMVGLEASEIKEINEHAAKAAALVRKYRSAPLDVAIIIRQHHGSVDGIGFPEKKSPHLSTIAKYLIISQELAYEILTNDELSMEAVLKNLQEKKHDPAFHNIVELFVSSLKPALV